MLRGAALLVAVLSVGCEASPPTSPDATPDSIPITIARVSQPSGLISPGAVIPPFTGVTIGGSFFLTEQDVQPLRRTVWAYACTGHDATSFRTGSCSGEGDKAIVGRRLFSLSLAYPGMPLDTEFIHILLIEETEIGDSLLPRPVGSVASTHYPISNVVGRLIAHLALEYPIRWR